MSERDDIATAIRDLIETLNERHGENIDRLNVTDKKIEEVIRRVDALHEAFPDDDTIGHRIYHESLIKRNDATTEFYQKLRLELATKGIWALLGIVVLAMGSYIKARLMG